MDQELIETKKCIHCDTDNDVRAKYCGVCGTAFESKQVKEFGNGQSLKFFYFLYNVSLAASVIMLFFMLINSYLEFQNYFASDIGLFLSFHTTRFALLINILNIVLVSLSLYTRIKDNKIGYSKVLIYRLTFSILSPIISFLIIYFEFGIDYIDINNTLMTIGSQLVAGVMIYIYLTKRFEFKWFDFSDIL